MKQTDAAEGVRGPGRPWGIVRRPVASGLPVTRPGSDPVAQPDHETNNETASFGTPMVRRRMQRTWIEGERVRVRVRGEAGVIEGRETWGCGQG